MNKVLLIDDEANNGWKEILEKVLFGDNPIEFALNVPEATELLNKFKYDIIFLDLRFGEEDHDEKNIEKFGGYNLLSDVIRKSLHAVNFSTPVILFTASNKIWNIFEMLQNGADSYYIKEHPDTSFDLEFSRRNFIRLKTNVPDLITLGHLRQNILIKMLKIIDVSKSKIANDNIRDRIEEKLKIGYAILFQKNSPFEKDKLLFNNELMAFIAFWSILEETVKDSFLDHWIKTGEKEGCMSGGNWTLRSGKRFVENLLTENNGQLTGCLRLGIEYNRGKYEENTVDINPGDKDFNFYTGKISLSLQIYAAMLLNKGWTAAVAKQKFEDINKFRNRVDFIHSSVSSIFTKKLSNSQVNQDAMAYCDKMLEFLIEFLA